MRPRDATLGRKYIKSFASGIAGMFITSAEHYAWLAHQHRIPVVTIDLMELDISPREFNIARNRNLARMCQDSLLRSIQRLEPPRTLVKAVLCAHFGIGDCSSLGGSPIIGRSVFTVTLTDERGKAWHLERVQEQMPLSP